MGAAACQTEGMGLKANVALTHELPEMKGTGDRRGAKWRFVKYGIMPARLREALNKEANILVDIEHEFSFPTPVR